jgi:membrane protease YdiL (CAAX protease family)
MDRSHLLSLSTVASLAILILLSTLLIPPWGISLLLFLISIIACLFITISVLYFKPDHQEIILILRRLKLWRVEPYWYAMAVLVPIGIWLIVLAHFVISGGLSLTIPSNLKLLPLILVASYVSEAGWRGFLLPRVLSFLSPIPASILVGLLWAACYAPLFYRDPYVMFLIIALGPVLSITSTWLFLETNESVPLTALFNAIFIIGALVIGPVSDIALALATALSALWGLLLVMRCGDCLLCVPTTNENYAASCRSKTKTGQPSGQPGLDNVYLFNKPDSRKPTGRFPKS